MSLMTPQPEADPRSRSNAAGPTISVVVPNYNHAQLLPRCLNAIVSQSVPPFELIIMDDASTDNSVQVAEDFVRRYPFVRLHRNEENLGVVATTNLGMKMAQGEFVLLAAADDEVLPGIIEKSAALLRQYPQAGLCCTIGDWVELSTGLNWHVGVGMGDKPCFLSPDRLFELERKGRVFIASNSATFRRAALIELGGLRPELRWQCDWFAFTVLAFRHGVCFVPEALARVYIYPRSYRSAGTKTAEHERSLRLLLDLLLSPEYRDVEVPIRRSGALFLFGAPLLKLLISQRAYRRFLTPAFLRKNLWHITKLQLKKITPAFLGNWYFKISGYRARPPQTPSPTGSTASV
jgi:glycosyltransferase involved in cell wall biosynthesis